MAYGYFTDGTTTLSYEYPIEDISRVIERSSNRSAGGQKKSQTAGSRLQIKVTVRTNQTGYDALINLLESGANAYFYTPATYTAYTSAIEVDILSINKDFDSSADIYIIGVEMEGVDFA